MKIELQLEPVKQVGSLCKTVTVATIDQYYAAKIGYNPLPLHKNGDQNSISIRQLAKRNGSLQGEILEVEQWQKLFTDIGFDTHIIDFQSNLSAFKDNIRKNLLAGNMIVACFAVDIYTRLPCTVEKNNEHAAIINGFDDSQQTLTMTHWGRQWTVPIIDFFNSSMSLLSTRKLEYYERFQSYVPVHKFDPQQRIKKYEPITDFSVRSPDDPSLKRSMVPRENTGFKGKLIVIKTPELEKIQTVRAQLTGEILVQKYIPIISQLADWYEKHTEDAERLRTSAIQPSAYAGQQTFFTPPIQEVSLTNSVANLTINEGSSTEAEITRQADQKPTVR